jgi:hypothetical protein
MRYDARRAPTGVLLLRFPHEAGLLLFGLTLTKPLLFFPKDKPKTKADVVDRIQAERKAKMIASGKRAMRFVEEGDQEAG